MGTFERAMGRLFLIGAVTLVGGTGCAHVQKAEKAENQCKAVAGQELKVCDDQGTQARRSREGRAFWKY